MKPKKLFRGIISYVPLLKSIIPTIGTGGSNNAEYCLNRYSQHKDYLIDNGCFYPVSTIGEIGPGDSVGIGLCALLDGVDRYYGLDAIAYTNVESNIQMLKKLICLYENKNIMVQEKTRNDLMFYIQNLNKPESKIKYYAPWWAKDKIVNNSLDIVISTAVMEHVMSLKETHQKIFDWLKPGGFCSHIIDYSAHEFSDCWHEHWFYSDFLWKILMHGRMYPLSRMPHSYHMNCIEKVGFEIQKIIPSWGNKRAEKKKISKSIVDYFKDSDLNIKSAIVVARKPA